MALTESEGLRLYRERCQARMPEAIREGPWIEESAWVEANVPLETRVEIHLQVSKDLRMLNDMMDQEGVPTEHPLEDPLYTVIQILWRGMPDDDRDRINGRIGIACEEEGRR